MPDEHPTNPEEQIFEEALKIEDLEKRSVFLDGACRGDQELRDRLAAMLEAHEGAVGFLDTLPEDQTILDEAPLGEGPGSQIGKYKLLEQIGQGGMGTVYLAEQRQPFVKRVALKIIKLGMDTKAVVARFQAEQQALALMNHPNIAKVLDGGSTEAGRPYFVMELVKGVPITEYCDKHKLTTEERLCLFIPVCQAVQHAHQKGIIHRDIKPSNVLVAHMDGKPLPMVIDFGIAKATNQRLTQETYFTEHGRVIGTMEYMAPEQAEGSQLDIDTRADIYSLGVLLYQLLTGSTPFPAKRLQKSGFREMMRIIQEEEPQRPSLRISTMTAEERTKYVPHHPEGLGRMELILRQELDWVLMACLEKDRARRYETANALAMELERYLRGEPIVRRPPSRIYLLNKLLRKHKPAFATAAAIAVILAGATGYSAYQAEVARKEKNRAVAAEAKTAAQEALTRTEKEKSEAINAWLTQHFLSQADAWTGFEAGQNRNATIQLKDALIQAVETLSEDFKDQPEIEGEIRLTVGKAFRSMGLMKEAEENLERAYELLKSSMGAAHTNTLSAQMELGQLIAFSQWFKGDTERAEKAANLMETAYEQALEAWGLSHPITLNLGILLGDGLIALLKFDRAERVIPSLARELGLPHGRSREYALDLWWRGARVYALLRRNWFRWAEAAAVLDLMYEEAGTEPGLEEDVRMAELINFRSHVLPFARDSYETGAEEFSRALEIAAKTVGEGLIAAYLHLNRGHIEMQQEMYEEAISDYRKSVRILIDTEGREHELVMQHSLPLLGVRGSRGDWNELGNEARSLRENFGITDAAFVGLEIWAGILSGDTNEIGELRNLCFSIKQTGNFNTAAFGDFNLLALPCSRAELPKLEEAVQRFVGENESEDWFEKRRVQWRINGALAYRKEDYVAARSYLEHAIKEMGDSPFVINSRLFLAMTLERLHEPAAAREQLAAASGLIARLCESGTIREWVILAQAMVLREEAERLILGQAESSRVNHETLAPAYARKKGVDERMNKAQVAARKREYRAALAKFESMLEHPDVDSNSSIHGTALNRIALLKLALDDEAGCVATLQERIQHDGEKAWLGINLARFDPDLLTEELRVRAHDPARLEFLENKWRKDPHWMDADTPLALGMMLYRAGDYEKALEALDLPMNSHWFRDPVDAYAFAAMAHWSLAEREEDSNHRRQARELLRRADELFKQRVAPGNGLYQNFAAIEMEISLLEADALIDPAVTNAPYVGTLPEVGFPTQR